MSEQKPSRVSPNCQALDLYTFVNLQLETEDNKQLFRSRLSDKNDDPFISNVWIVGYVTSVRFHTKPQTNGEDHTLDLKISDGCYEIRIVQFKTSLTKQDFEENQYYSFIVRPFLGIQNQNSEQAQRSMQNQGALISYHKITNYNEVTAHISESIRSFYFLLAPFPSLVVKIIKAYTANGFAISDENLRSHLHLYESSPDFAQKNNELNQFINALKENGFIEQKESGYLMVNQSN